MPAKILVVDDEEKVRNIVTSYLEEEYEVLTAARGDTALEIIYEQDVDLLILDLMLPGLAGEKVAEKVRERSDLPILMLTARSKDQDKIAGFEHGADDYLVKPFNPRELQARVKAILKRTGALKLSDKEISFPEYCLKIYPQAKEVILQEEEVDLTATEFKLLEVFINNQGQILSRDQLMDKVFGLDYQGFDRTIDVHVKNLRKKLKLQQGEFILTVYGMGYKLDGGLKCNESQI